jgi:hypothetical protein
MNRTDVLDDPPAIVANAAKQDVPLALPTRIISYAWGESYLDELLSLTLPALLAPGNLPFVAAQVPTEIVLLTEERLFARVNAHPTAAKLRRHCPLRLIGLDDLVASSKDGYGMALTYVLHRSFCDLGQAMTDAWQIFLNADFILADGSLKTLMGHLQRGERIVAAPSYCVVADDIKPELVKRIEAGDGILSVTPREMARLALRHRHNTVRGKTVNQSEFHIYYMDQFYWQVDENTLLGRQLPIAIVGMRPERHIAEPTAYWDHGLMEEFCPNAAVKVIGDSDEFLMIELRGGDVAADQIKPGWPAPRDVAERMIHWMTPYQRSFGSYPLVLHAGDISPAAAAEDDKLAGFVDEVLSCLPDFLPSHRDHPQWLYHWGNFVRARHGFLSTKLGMDTTGAPPGSLSEVDRLWWLLDGTRKKLAERRAESERLKRVLSEVVNELETRTAQELSAATWRYFESATAPAHIPATDAVAGARRAAAGNAHPTVPEDARKEPPETSAALDVYWYACAAIHRRHRSGIQAAEHIRRAVTVEHDLEVPVAELEERYERVIARKVRSAAIPIVRTQRGPIARDDGRAALARLLQWIYGEWPRVRPASPHWSGLRHLLAIVDDAGEKGAKDVLIVGERSGIAASIVALPVQQVRVSLRELQTGNLVKAFARPTQFDLCVCDLDDQNIWDVGEIFAAARPFVRDGGLLVGLCANLGGPALEINHAHLLAQLGQFSGIRLQYAGSPKSAAAVRAVDDARLGFGQRHPFGWARAMSAFAASLIGARLANRNEARNPEGVPLAHGGHTSITISARRAPATAHGA